MQNTMVVPMFVHSTVQIRMRIKEEIKENVSSMAPKAAVKRVYDNAGGVTNLSSLSEVPCNRRQAYNAKSHQPQYIWDRFKPTEGFSLRLV